ncbi:MAG: GntR family transcriptional regulator [Firmicutes bacterium]|nr:GntR family transcriptional regulator [Bacillota bacterium]MDD4263495.1 GntR family transcriptional regulator [Bacillota bacterium]MDD4694284.1 GntR family transcriptional regulator [Bacillota bacterium]
MSRLGPIQLDNYQPLRELVFEAIREAIIDGTLRPGERLMEVVLAEELGVSRTPVREAIRKLELEKLVIMVPRKGAYVADVTKRDVAEVFEIRRALEGLAAQLASNRVTEEQLEKLERYLVKIADAIDKGDIEQTISIDVAFHDVLYQASGNERLEDMISNLREHIQRYRSTSLAYPGRMKQALIEHRKVVEAIANRDADLAKKLAEQHIVNAENSLMEAIFQSKKK